MLALTQLLEDLSVFLTILNSTTIISMTLSFNMLFLIINLKTKMFTLPLTICIVRINLLFFFFLFVFGKQGIPLWFRCFPGIKDPDAFQTSLITEGIGYVYNLFINKDCNLIYLADRWFNNTSILKFIDDIGCTYCIRTKSNISIEIDNFEDAGMIEHIYDIEPYMAHPRYFDSVRITKQKFQTKLTVSKTATHKEPFFILTNGNTRDAIKHYGYRFSSIEFIFKNQKSNGFYLESTQMRNIHAFSTLFTIACVAILWLTILGADYTKNKNHFKSYLKIKYSKRNGSNFKRIFSLFNTGLLYWNIAFCCTKYAVIKCNFVLYDI